MRIGMRSLERFMRVYACGRRPRVPPWTTGRHTALPAPVADARAPGGECRQSSDPQIRRHIVPALRAGGRHAEQLERKMGRMVARAGLSTQAKSGTSKGALSQIFAEGSKATGSSARAVVEGGTKQSEQSSGWAQTSPACSQADETSSQAQCSAASTPTVAHRRKARQVKSLERAKATDVRFRAT
jgi:hypothetical protein